MKTLTILIGMVLLICCLYGAATTPQETNLMEGKMFSEGDKVQNIHTQKIYVITDVDWVPVTSPTDIQPIYVLSDGARRNEETMLSHFQKLSP